MARLRGTEENPKTGKREKPSGTGFEREKGGRKRGNTLYVLHACWTRRGISNSARASLTSIRATGFENHATKRSTSKPPEGGNDFEKTRTRGEGGEGVEADVDAKLIGGDDTVPRPPPDYDADTRGEEKDRAWTARNGTERPAASE